MTSLIAWSGVDAHGSSSLYIASDSRISFEPYDLTRPAGHVIGGAWWNVGVKLFACKHSPDVFGYCGDVIFPALALNQFVQAADEGLVFAEGANAAARNYHLDLFLRSSHSIQQNALDRDYTVLHAARDGEGNNCTFSVVAHSYIASEKDGVIRSMIPLEIEAD